MSMDWEMVGLRVRIPSEVPLALLLRHAERPPLPMREPGHEVALTKAGIEASQRLGQMLGNQLIGVNTSPVLRCQETAAALRAGAGARCEAVLDPMLGDPGVFVLEPKQAWNSWLEWGPDTIAHALMTGERVPPGFAEPAQATRKLAAHLIHRLPSTPGVHVFVTHDTILGPFTAQALGQRLNAETWPGFLHGAFLWRDSERYVLAYREWTQVLG